MTGAENATSAVAALTSCVTAFPVEPVTYNIRDLTVQIGNPNTNPTSYPFSVGYWYLRNGLNGDQDAYNTHGNGVHRFKYLPTYDALDRMIQSDYYEAATGGGWNNPNSYDLKGITYDASGNILTLQRYRSDNTLIDNLTYTYASNSNRLTSVTDAVPTTSETWDAESGSFTYDANGNMLTAPAPYSITAATYDPANLPLTLTRTGIVSSYRYDAAGERITKQVGSGDVQVYLLDGSTTLGVATLSNAGAFDSSYFNLVWESRVVGRQPWTGSRKYYYLDILGSTRAVATGTTITEAYDADAWGVLMAGRTLNDPHGTTKEGFGSKETDAETGLEYFGARYYMAELGRWAAVDPLADKMPEWSTYNYVYDNPAGLTDPDGRQAIQALLAQHPLFVAGVGEGFKEGAAATWHAITHPKETLRGVATLVAAGQGNPIAQYQVAAGMQQSFAAAVKTWKTGEEGKGKVVGRFVEAGTEAAVTWGAGEAIGSLKAAIGARLGADAAENGVVYLRTNPLTGEAYVGQSKSAARFAARQGEHDAALGVGHDYEILGNAASGKDLDVLEETKIRELGGPQSEGGSLANKRHQMSDQRYKDAGGTTPHN